MKKFASRTFRPWQQNDDELKVADDLGMNVSQLINEVLEEHLRDHMKKKVERMRRTLSQSVGAH